MSETLLSVDNLKVHYPIRGGLLGRTVNFVKAVDGVSLNIARGKALHLLVSQAVASPRSALQSSA